MKVLIADDDRVLSQVLAAVLRKKGWQVSTAFDAMQAVMVAMRDKPDAIILDVAMPGGTGLQALKTLKMSTKTSLVPVLVISGMEDEQLSARVTEMGAADFLPKPVEPERVYEALLAITKSA